MTQLVGHDDLVADFRSAMRRLAATVSIITCADETGRHGMTATAVTSVCVDPPTLLVCINSAARLFPKIPVRKRFCVNLLKTSHVDLSRCFGMRENEQDRFAIGDWADLEGLPYLRDAQASLFCSLQRVVEVGSHGIFIARIDRINIAREIEPLIYQNGAYAVTSELAG